jgi:2',3'-cyclic-nucleotide 2'-phosphodiesterase (5'-nucleotidase family)
MGYTASAIGNHEFDFTVDILRQRIKQAQFPYLSANIRTKSTCEIPDFAVPYIIKNVNDVKIGVVGLTTTSTPWSTFPDYVVEYNFIPYADALHEIVPEVKSKGAELLIVIGHICREELQDLVPVAKELGISILTGGHCHQLYSDKIDGIVLFEGGSFFASYAKADIIFDSEADTVISISHSIHKNEDGSEDIQIKRVVQKWEAELGASLSEIIGYASAEIGRNSVEMANMITDSWLFVYPQADVALTNRGGIRQSIPAGNITLETIVGLLPFENSILELKLTGKELIECIDRLEIGGMTTIGGYYLEDGTPVSSDSVYSVLTTDYLYARDDHIFSTYDPQPYNTSIHFRQPLIDWLKSLKTTEQNPVNNYLDTTARR